MVGPINLVEHAQGDEPIPQRPDEEREQAPEGEGVPSNPVYARVGDTILLAARDGVRRNLPPKDIVREIREEHQVHLSVGELRLLLASRRIPATRSS